MLQQNEMGLTCFDLVGKFCVLEAEARGGGKEAWRESPDYTTESHIHRSALLQLITDVLNLLPYHHHRHLSLFVSLSSPSLCSLSQLLVCQACPTLKPTGLNLVPCSSPNVSLVPGQNFNLHLYIAIDVPILCTFLGWWHQVLRRA